jgi:hypothetical protein
MESLNYELQQVMEEVLVSLLGETFDVPPAAADEPLLTCAVCIRGGWNGQVIVQASLGLAGLAATRMFGKESSASDSQIDAQDALREIANIVAGNVKPLFGQSNDLGLPQDLPMNSLYPPPTTQLAQAVVQHGGGSLEVRVFETR